MIRGGDWDYTWDYNEGSESYHSQSNHSQSSIRVRQSNNLSGTVPDNEGSESHHSQRHGTGDEAVDVHGLVLRIHLYENVIELG